MKVSVVICAFTEERWNDLIEAVASCAAQSRRADEIIVVVDHNRVLLERVRDEMTGVLVTENDLARGLSGARTSGVRRATGDAIAFLDDDAVAQGDWLENLVTPLEDALVAGVGGWIEPWWEGAAAPWFPSTFLWVLGCSYEGLPQSGQSIRNPIGANMALRRRVFDVVGGFTPGIGRLDTVPLGGEETELCLRYSAAVPAERFVMSREAVVRHRVGASRLTWRYFLTRCWAEGLSKSTIARRVGSSVGLSAERTHLRHAIPREFVVGVRSIPRDPRVAFRRLGMIASGTACAGAGFAWGYVFTHHDHSGRPTLDPTFGASNSAAVRRAWQPVRMVRVDIDEPSDRVVEEAPAGTRLWVEALRREQVVGVVDAFVERAGQLPFDVSVLRSLASDIVPLAMDAVPDERLPRASVVISTLGENPGELSTAVESLLAMDYPAFEVIVVDNRTDVSGEPLVLVDDPRVRVVVEAHPGVSAGRNRGVAAARGEFVAFTDDDVVVDRRWLRALGATFVLAPEVEGIGGLVLPYTLDTIAELWFEEFYGGFNQGFRPEVMSLARPPKDDGMFPYAPGRFGAGCNMAFRRSTLERLGGFDTSLGAGTPARGGEDLGLCVALVQAGGTFAFEPSALVRHRHRRGEREFLAQVWGYGIGLSAMYCAVIARDPSQLIAIARRVPRGMTYLLRTRARRSDRRTPSYPRCATAIQILGMGYGPIAYARSCLRDRHVTSGGRYGG
jgi:O-antigen biosynthesis protein